MPMEFFISILRMSLTLTGNFMSLKSSFLAKSLSAFVILFGLWSAGCTLKGLNFTGIKFYGFRGFCQFRENPRNLIPRKR